jgi:hypothetical protein
MSLPNPDFAKTLSRAPSPHRFSDGEKVAEGRMRGTTGALHTTDGHVRRPPSSGFATFSPRKKRGGRRRSARGCGDEFEFLIVDFSNTLNRAPSPHRFSEGEKLAEGWMRGTTGAHHTTDGHVRHPPSSGFATFSPRKKRGGRRRSIGERGNAFDLLIVDFAKTRNRAPSPHRFSEGEKGAEGRMRGLAGAHRSIGGCGDGIKSNPSAAQHDAGYKVPA